MLAADGDKSRNNGTDSGNRGNSNRENEHGPNFDRTRPRSIERSSDIAMVFVFSSEILSFGIMSMCFVVNFPSWNGKTAVKGPSPLSRSILPIYPIPGTNKNYFHE